MTTFKTIHAKDCTVKPKLSLNGKYLGPALKDLAKKLGISQEKLAIKLGVCIGTYHAWRRGTSLPVASHYLDILMLDVDISTWASFGLDRLPPAVHNSAISRRTSVSAKYDKSHCAVECHVAIESLCEAAEAGDAESGRKLRNLCDTLGKQVEKVRQRAASKPS